MLPPALRRRTLSLLLVAAVGAAPFAAHALAQAAPSADSLLVRLPAITQAANLPAAGSCTSTSADATRLCTGLIAERRAELTGDRGDGRHAEELLERTVLDQPRSVVAWYGLGRVRLQLSRDTVFSKGGALMPVGMSYRNGAANAFAQALELDASFAPAAVALASTPVPREGAGALKDRVALLRHARAELSPEALFATAELERDGGSVDSAIAIERELLAAGKLDSGLVSLGLARDLYHIGEPAEGHAVLIRGAGTRTSAAKQAYRDELSWVASPAELAQWDSLPVADRGAWVATFWAKRDMLDGRKDGSRLAEHYKRVEYAMNAFRIAIPQTGRQRFHSALPSDDFAGEDATRQFALRNADCFPELGRLMMDAATVGHETPFDYYRPIQDQVDDRGTVWIRHGQPDKMVRSITGDIVEIWQYLLPTGPLTLEFQGSDFQGSAGASTLVPTILAMSPVVRNQVCALDRSLCSFSGRIEPVRISVDTGTFIKACGIRFTGRNGALAKAALMLNGEVVADGMTVSSAMMVHARDAGRAAIDQATTTDGFPRTFTHAVTPSLQVYGLDRATGGAPRIVVAFALPGDQLQSTKIADGRTVYPVNVQVQALRRRDAARAGMDTLRQFVTAQPLIKGQFLTGIAELPVGPGSYDASVIVTQADGRGAIGSLSGVVVPAPSETLQVSNLVFGRDGSGVQWNSGDRAVPLNPLNTYPRSGSANAYVQLAGLKAGTPYTMTFAFYRRDDDRAHAPRLAVSFNQVTQLSRLEGDWTLGLERLDPGSYRVVFSLKGGGAEVTTESSLVVVK